MQLLKDRQIDDDEEVNLYMHLSGSGVSCCDAGKDKERRQEGRD